VDHCAPATAKIRSVPARNYLPPDIAQAITRRQVST
jgi:hypothetical protein